MKTLSSKETKQKIKDWLDACSWGDVPDYADAIAAYMTLDGYKLVKVD